MARLRKKRAAPAKRKPDVVHVSPELSTTEQDIVSHLEQGYQLETDSLGGDPVLRRPKDHEMIRPPSANRTTITTLEERGVIVQGKTLDPLKIVWRLKNR